MSSLPRLGVILATALSVVLLPGSRAAGQQAGTALGPERAWVVALALSPAFGSDGNAWIAAYGGRVFATNDGGQSWAPARAGISDPIVTSVAASPNYVTDRTVFAAADDGVFASTDGGVTWAGTSSGLSGRLCRVISIDPGFSTNRRLLVATDAGIYRSTDGGAQWLPTSGETAAAVSVVQAGGGLAIAGLGGGGMAISHDAGGTWSSVPGFPTGHVPLSVTITPDGRVLAGTDAGLYASADGGQAWHATGLATGRVDAVTLSARYGSDATVYAGTSSGAGVFVSHDGGETWGPAGASGPRFVSALQDSTRVTGDELVAGTPGDGVFVSEDGGSTWQSANGSLDAAQIDTLTGSGGSLLAAGPGGVSMRDGSAGWRSPKLPTTFVTSAVRSGSTVFAGTLDHGLQVSYDTGSTWHDAALSGAGVAAVAISPSFAGGRVVLVASDWVDRSLDAGITWQRAAGMAGTDVRRFRFSPAFAADGTAFATTTTHGVYRTTDRGATWQAAASGLPPGNITDIVFSDSFSQDRTAFAGTGGHGVYVSHDAGSTWTPLAPQPPRLLISAMGMADGQLLAGTEKGIYRLIDGNWTRVGGSWDAYVTDLVYSSDSALLFAGTLGDGVWSFSLAAPTATPIATNARATATVTATAGAKKSPTPRAKPTSTARPTPSATPRPGKFVRAWVMPKPVHRGAIELLRIQGKAGSVAAAHMVAFSWRLDRTVMLDRKGMGAFGFVAPRTTFNVTVSARKGTLSGSTIFRIPVIP